MIQKVTVSPVQLPTDIDPPAHEHSHSTTDCGPLVGRPTHSRCPGWLSGVYGLVACDCWCHQRRRTLDKIFVQFIKADSQDICAICGDPDDGHDHVPTQQSIFCTECGGPFTEEQGGDPQYGGHWDTCPNRPKGPSEVTMLGEDDVLTADD